MNVPARGFVFLAVLSFLLSLAGCASKEKSQYPDVYQGGQYYGDAIHSDNQKQQH